MIPVRIRDLICTEDEPVMCCLCFGAFAVKDLNVLPDGQREDVCNWCAEAEKPTPTREDDDG